MVRKARVRKSAEERKSEVVAAALNLADKIGPDRVTTETLAKSVGLTHPGLFRHFPRKLNIWQAVADHIGEQMENRWEHAERSGARQPEVRLRQLVTAQLELLEAFPAIPAILFSRELQAENDQLRKSFLFLMRGFHRRLGRNVANAQALGVFRSDVDPDDAAYVVLALIQGLTLRWSISARRFSLVEEGERLLEIQFQGLYPAPADTNDRLAI